MQPTAVLIHVPDVELALSWYKKVFVSSQLVRSDQNTLAVLDIDGFLLELVKADDKVGSGKTGSVLYWLVPDLDATVAQFLKHGAMLYRGPIDIENGLAMCQLEDPYGNLIGFRGNANGKKT